jgi:hypothetical protein
LEIQTVGNSGVSASKGRQIMPKNIHTYIHTSGKNLIK